MAVLCSTGKLHLQRARSPVDAGKRSDRKRSLHCPPTCFTTPVLLHTSGSLQEQAAGTQGQDSVDRCLVFLPQSCVKPLGDKKNEISPEDRSAVTQLYADFTENEYCKIYSNEEFIYREYTVMQPLQRSYAMAWSEWKPCCPKVRFLLSMTSQGGRTGKCRGTGPAKIRKAGGLPGESACL